MNRRDFFKTIGIPALVLPLGKFLKPKQNFEDWLSAEEVINWHEYEDMPRTFPWFNIVSKCPQCGCKLNIPSSSPIAKLNEDSWLYEAKIPCGLDKCIGIHNISVRIKRMGFQAYWIND